jgi:hypothetical protein
MLSKFLSHSYLRLDINLILLAVQGLSRRFSKLSILQKKFSDSFSFYVKNLPMWRILRGMFLFSEAIVFQTSGYHRTLSPKDLPRLIFWEINCRDYDIQKNQEKASRGLTFSMSIVFIPFINANFSIYLEFKKWMFAEQTTLNWLLTVIGNYLSCTQGLPNKCSQNQR